MRPNTELDTAAPTSIPCAQHQESGLNIDVSKDIREQGAQHGTGMPGPTPTYRKMRRRKESNADASRDAKVQESNADMSGDAKAQGAQRRRIARHEFTGNPSLTCRKTRRRTRRLREPGGWSRAVWLCSVLLLCSMYLHTSPRRTTPSWGQYNYLLQSI